MPLVVVVVGGVVRGGGWEAIAIMSCVLGGVVVVIGEISIVIFCDVWGPRTVVEGGEG